MSTFEEYSKSSYARVVIVNPLHESLHKLAFCVTTTSNWFNIYWMREHWNGLKMSWDDNCRSGVGPLLGHHSNGDARSRMLMTKDSRGRRGSFLGC